MKNLIILIILKLMFIPLAISQNNLPAYLPKNGLVGWWPFNGNANDESGNGHNGIVNGATSVKDRNEKEFAAYIFDGNNDFIQIPHHPKLNSLPFSISFWMKSNSQNGIGKLFNKVCCSSWDGWDIEIVTSTTDEVGVWHFEYYNSTCKGIYQTYCSPIPYPKINSHDDIWHHCVFSVDSSVAKVFYDGKLIHHQLWDGPPVSPKTTVPLDIARYGYGNFGFYKGMLDDIGIWNRALTEKEISELYNGIESDSCNISISTDKVPVIIIGQEITLTANTGSIKNTYSIGDTGPGGGLVFYDSGSDSTDWRYMEVTKNDNDANHGMGCYCTEIKEASKIIGAGYQNTINWAMENCSGWAKAALNYSNNGFKDWFVPSQDELNQIYTNLHKNSIGNFKGDNQYWSSTPGSYGSCGINGGAIVQNFKTGAQYGEYRSGYGGAGFVRWVRKFKGKKQLNYTWSNGLKTQTITVKPDKTIKYFVTITDGTISCVDSIEVVVNEVIDTCKEKEPITGKAISYQRGKSTCSLNDYKNIIPECWTSKYSLCSRRYKFAGSSTRVNGVLTLLYDKDQSDLQTLINRSDYTGPRYMGRSDEYECFICEIFKDDGSRNTDKRIYQEESKISVYPNPFEEVIIIEGMEEYSEEMIVTITDILGRNYHTERLQALLLPYELKMDDQVPGGIYFLQVRNKNGELLYQTKLIKKD